MNIENENKKTVEIDPDYRCMSCDGVDFEPDQNYGHRLIFYRNEIVVKDNKVEITKKNLLFEVRLPISAFDGLYEILKEFTIPKMIMKALKEEGIASPEMYNSVGVHLSKIRDLAFDTDDPHVNDESLKASKLYMLEKFKQMDENEDEE